MFSPKKPHNNGARLCAWWVLYGGVELLLLLLVCLTWKLFHMCRPHCSDFQHESIKSFNTFYRCHPFWTCHILAVFHCLSLIIPMAPIKSQKLIIPTEVTSVTGLPLLPWSSLTRDGVDDGWPCDTWVMSRESPGISCCWNRRFRAESGGRRGWSDGRY